jgi:hypothetical protein
MPVLTNFACVVDHVGFTQNSIAVNPEGSFFDFAVTDVALLHATLALVALHLGSNGSKVSSIPLKLVLQEALYNQIEAVRDVNHRLNTPDSYLSDSLVAAVAILANCEVSS